MELGNLPQIWAEVESKIGAWELLESDWRRRSRNLLSARTFDQAQVAGTRTYFEVSRFLGVAQDNHEALLCLLEHRGATLFAPWSLLRPVFEASFHAYWILAPDDGVERRARGLRSEVLDALAQHRHKGAYKSIPEYRELIKEVSEPAVGDSMAIYAAEADALGRPFAEMKRKINVIDELKALPISSTDLHLSAGLVAAWRFLSGCEHGHGWSLLHSSDLRQKAVVPGGQTAHMTINDDVFVQASRATYALLLTAINLFNDRSLNPAG